MTTGDLQGACEARAMDILRKQQVNLNPLRDYQKISSVSEKILQGMLRKHSERRIAMTDKKSVLHVEIPADLKKDFARICLEADMKQNQRIEILIRQDVIDHRYLIKK
jgi:hypothetical protein